MRDGLGASLNRNGCRIFAAVPQPMMICGVPGGRGLCKRAHPPPFRRGQ